MVGKSHGMTLTSSSGVGKDTLARFTNKTRMPSKGKNHQVTRVKSFYQIYSTIDVKQGKRQNSLQPAHNDNNNQHLHFESLLIHKIIMGDFDLGLLDDDDYKVSVLRTKLLGIAECFMYRLPKGSSSPYRYVITFYFVFGMLYGTMYI
jgi:hypothetical protein